MYVCKASDWPKNNYIVNKAKIGLFQIASSSVIQQNNNWRLAGMCNVHNTQIAFTIISNSSSTHW